jgi:hypothetical protein
VVTNEIGEVEVEEMDGEVILKAMESMTWLVMLAAVAKRPKGMSKVKTIQPAQ